MKKVGRPKIPLEEQRQRVTITLDPNLVKTIDTICKESEEPKHDRSSLIEYLLLGETDETFPCQHILAKLNSPSKEPITQVKLIPISKKNSSHKFGIEICKECFLKLIGEAFPDWSEKAKETLIDEFCIEMK